MITNEHVARLPVMPLLVQYLSPNPSDPLV